MKRFFFLITLAVTGCRGDSDYSGQLTGTVRSVYTNRPAAYVWVEASIQKGMFNPRFPTLGKALTDANGSFQLAIDPKGTGVYFDIRSSGGSQGPEIAWYAVRRESIDLRSRPPGPLVIPVYTSRLFQPTFSNQRPVGKDDQLTVVYSYRKEQILVNSQEVYAGDSLEFRTRRGITTDAEIYLKYELRVTKGGQTSVRTDSIFIEPDRITTTRISY